jgi:adenylate kinase family enzyme
MGAGKSTFANKLGKKLGREVTHLDKIYYKPGWERRHQTREEWKQAIRDLAAREEWIIDGNYTSTLDIRLAAADTIIFFNFSKILCFFRITKRSMKKVQPFDKEDGNFNHLSWDLIKALIMYPRKKVLNMLGEYKDTKKIFIVRDDREAGELLKNLGV